MDLVRKKVLKEQEVDVRGDVVKALHVLGHDFAAQVIDTPKGRVIFAKLELALSEATKEMEALAQELNEGGTGE